MEISLLFKGSSAILGIESDKSDSDSFFIHFFFFIVGKYITG